MRQKNCGKVVLNRVPLGVAKGHFCKPDDGRRDGGYRA